MMKLSSTTVVVNIAIGLGYYGGIEVTCDVDITAVFTPLRFVENLEYTPPSQASIESRREKKSEICQTKMFASDFM